MVSEEIYIVFTMDVERVNSKCISGGPKNWELGRKSVLSFSRALEKRNLKATFFITPDFILHEKTIFNEVIKAKHELGLHLHLECWGDNYKKYHEWKPIGFYQYENIKDFIQKAKDQYKCAVNLFPSSFRGGFFSANKDLYKVLIEEEILQGSTTFPGRNRKDVKALWKNANRMVHIKYSSFVEVPPTSWINPFGMLYTRGDPRFERHKNLKFIKRAIL